MTDDASGAFVPFYRPSLDREEEEAVLSVLRSGWLTTGKVTAAFEEEFARYTGAKHALAVSSATAALHLALEALGVGPGTVVITTAYTFAATAEVVRYLGADPLFVDIDPDTFNIDPAAMESALEECRRAGRTVSAVIPVHVAGLPCDMAAITRIAKRFGVPVLEDAAHAFPARTPEGFVGTIGDAGAYSFYATKPMTTGEGGMLVTNRDDVARRARVMRLHGIDHDVWDRYTAPGASWRYDIIAPGFKYNLTDIAAALGRVQLRKAADFLARRAVIAHRYLEAFGDLDFLQLPRASREHTWHLFIVRVRPEKLVVDRDELAAELARRGIGISVHFIPLHVMSYYREKYRIEPESLPRSMECYRTAISLPLSPALSEAEVDRVIAVVRETGARFSA